MAWRLDSKTVAIQYTMESSNFMFEDFSNYMLMGKNWVQFMVPFKNNIPSLLVFYFSKIKLILFNEWICLDYRYSNKQTLLHCIQYFSTVKKNADTIFIRTDFMKNFVEYYSSRNFFWCVRPSDRINLGELWRSEKERFRNK